jgi:hypothetical protein
MFDDGGLSPFGNSPIFQTKHSKKRVITKKKIYILKFMFGLARSLAES